MVDLDALQHEPEINHYFDDVLTDGVLTASDWSTSTSSTVSEGAPFQKASLTSAKIPSFINVMTEPCETPTNLPAVLLALHALDEEIILRNISVDEFYKEQNSSSPLLSKNSPLLAHVDGGALATTCHLLYYIYCYHEYTAEEAKRVPRLKVADDTLHRPIGEGYLKVPCKGTPPYRFVKTFYTPPIPATIVSPDALGSDLGLQRLSHVL